MFQQSFKYYKAKNPPPELHDVIDPYKENTIGIDSRLKDISKTILPNICFPGIIDSSQWRVFELVNRPGLVFIQNPFTDHAQRYWITRSICDYPKHPNHTNLPSSVIDRHSAHSSEPDGGEQHFDWWKTGQSIEDPQERSKFLKSLRWTTLGYHYDWTNKLYDEAAKTAFPKDLVCLCRHFAKLLGFEQFQPEAAIVNYYPVGSTLAGHTDHSEKNLDAPLFSFSFGQPAIFLIGGASKDEQPDAVFLRSGDVIVMTEASRLCYHAVPRVFKDCTEQRWCTREQELPSDKSLEKPEVQTILCSSTISATAATGCRRTVASPHLDLVWGAFVDYISNSRININIRQVLNEGEKQL